jgi:hypothetical protein
MFQAFFLVRLATNKCFEKKYETMDLFIVSVVTAYI